MLINTYEDKGALEAVAFYVRNVEGTPDEEYVINRMKELNGHA
jgi:hypothetical protein